MEDVLGIAIRVLVMYTYALALVRLSGKRTFGQLSPLDAVVTFIIGDLFDDVIWAEVPLSKGVVGFSTIVLMHMLVTYATFRSRGLDRLLMPNRTVVVRDGQFVEEGIRNERLRREHVESLLRTKCIEDASELKEADIESTDQLGYLHREETKPAQKRDLPLLEQAVS